MTMDARTPDCAVASTHVFRFRTFRDAGRSLLRDSEGLGRVEGLRFSRLVFVGAMKTEGFTIGVVDPRRQMAMCIWDHEAALERFRDHSRIGLSWRDATAEYCEVRMVPFRARGSYRGHEPLAGLRSERIGSGPVALWTFARIPPRGLHYFWGSIRHAARELLRSPGLVAGTAGPEYLYTGAMTFTIWESLDEALRFSYRERPHRQIVNDVRARNLLADLMFVRACPYAAEGDWPPHSRFASRFESFARALPGHPVSAGPARS